MNVRRIEHGEADYPAVLYDRLNDAAPRYLYALGDTAIIRKRLLDWSAPSSVPASE